ncbi:MAG: hypothetical protein KAU12_01820 [Candidatus Omnitrophica bacterium]|nr:hypothetical protein [Candidatus Omnitrophota bacterium]
MLENRVRKIWLMLFLLAVSLSTNTEAANVFYSPPENSQVLNSQLSPASFSLTYGPTKSGVSFEGHMVDFPHIDGQIAAFIDIDGKKVCVGVSKIDLMKKYKMTIYGNDPSTSAIDGAREGDRVSFKVIISGKPASLILAEGSDEPVWFFNKDKENINLRLEKDGMMAALTGGAGGGIMPAVFSYAEAEEETGGFGIPLTSEGTEAPVILSDAGAIPPSEPTPVIPEPSTLFMIAAGLICLKLGTHPNFLSHTQ